MRFEVSLSSIFMRSIMQVCVWTRYKYFVVNDKIIVGKGHATRHLHGKRVAHASEKERPDDYSYPPDHYLDRDSKT